MSEEDAELRKLKSREKVIYQTKINVLDAEIKELDRRLEKINKSVEELDDAIKET